MKWKTASAIEHKINERTIESIILAIEYANTLGLRGEKMEKVTCDQFKYGSDPIALLIQFSHSKKKNG